MITSRSQSYHFGRSDTVSHLQAGRLNVSCSRLPVLPKRTMTRTYMKKQILQVFDDVLSETVEKGT